MENTPVRGYKKLIIVLFITLASLICGSQAVFAESSLTLALSSSQINLNPSNQDLNSAVQAINVSTTSSVGYIVNFATSGSTTSLVNKNDSSKTIPTFTLPSGSSSIPASSVGYGYGYSIDNGVNYRPVPNPSGNSDTIFETFSAGTNSHVLTYGAKVSGLDIAGSYDNTFTIFAIVKLEPCPVNKICYYGNGDDGTGNMSDQPTSSNTETTLIASNFSRPGYGFAGWNTEPDGTGTNYGPSETITTGDLSTLGMQLYARWVPSTDNLQNWHGCHNLAKGTVIALTDTRDNSTYAVTKYADNKCWTMENLRLDLSKSDLTINSLNTNNPSSKFMNSVNVQNNRPSSTNTFCTAINSACIDQVLFNTNNTNRSLTASYSANDTTSSWYSYGNYYNWYTATAGYGTYSFSSSGATVSGDLCPAGWELPTGIAKTGDLVNLDIAIGGSGINDTLDSQQGIASSKRWRAYPLNFLYSGEQKGSSAANRNISSTCTTSNSSSSERTYNLWLRPGAVWMNPNNTQKVRGQTIRCHIKEEYVYGNVHYDANGGTGTMTDDIDVYFGDAVAANNEFTKTHSAFVGWNTSADGTGLNVAEGGSVAAASKQMNIAEGGTLTLYAIWQSAYSVVYNGNNASTGVMTETNNDVVQSQSIKLISPNFLRSGYGFAGWSTDASAATKLINGQQVIIYGPNEDIQVSSEFLSHANANDEVTLYAVWLPADSNYTLQTFGSTQCNALSNGDILALTDSRDSQTYAVAKLGDNHCWMLENLRLNPSTTTFSNSNTNLPTASFVTDAPSSSTSNTLCGDNTTACINQIAFNADNINSSLTPNYYSNNSTPHSWYSYGVMYNWYTATAGNGSYGISSGSVSGDICPAGWRLPTGGSGGEFESLNTIINNGSTVVDTKIRKYPNNFIYSGDFNQTVPSGRSRYGRLWSATASTSTNAYRFGYTSIEVTPIKAFSKWDAFAVRCIVK